MQLAVSSNTLGMPTAFCYEPGRFLPTNPDSRFEGDFLSLSSFFGSKTGSIVGRLNPLNLSPLIEIARDCSGLLGTLSDEVGRNF